VKLPEKGDYVLATKYSDGDPHDPWCIGFYDCFERERHFVVDLDGRTFRARGFRRAKKISKERGDWILSQKEYDLKFSGFSMWHFARMRMDK
jgi:hypothetical protein